MKWQGDSLEAQESPVPSSSCAPALSLASPFLHLLQLGGENHCHSVAYFFWCTVQSGTKVLVQTSLMWRQNLMINTVIVCWLSLWLRFPTSKCKDHFTIVVQTRCWSAVVVQILVDYNHYNWLHSTFPGLNIVPITEGKRIGGVFLLFWWQITAWKSAKLYDVWSLENLLGVCSQLT